MKKQTKIPISMPAVNGLTPKEEARFMSLLRKDTTLAEYQEFKRLKRKRWAPDNHFCRIVARNSPELFDALTALASAAARVVEDQAQPTSVHMRELDRRRAAASSLLAEINREGWPKRS